VVRHGEPTTDVTNYAGVVENGAVSSFPRVFGPMVAW